MDFQTIDAILKQYGLPTAYLGATMFGVYKVSGWAATEVIVPVRNALIEYFASFKTFHGDVIKLLQDHRELISENSKSIQLVDRKIDWYIDRTVAHDDPIRSTIPKGPPRDS